MKINIAAMKSLIPYAYGAVKHFSITAGRLEGKLALREQLNYEEASGKYSSYEMVNLDRAELKAEIVKLADKCAASGVRLNNIAKAHDLTPPVQGLDDAALSEFIAAVDKYVVELVQESDYAMWAEEIKTFKM